MVSNKLRTWPDGYTVPAAGLYSDALREYVARHDPGAVTDALNEVWDGIEEPIDPTLTAAALAALRRSAW